LSERISNDTALGIMVYSRERCPLMPLLYSVDLHWGRSWRDANPSTAVGYIEKEPSESVGIRKAHF